MPGLFPHTAVALALETAAFAPWQPSAVWPLAAGVFSTRGLAALLPARRRAWQPPKLAVIAWKLPLSPRSPSAPSLP